MESIIILFYTHKKIKEGAYSDMVKVTKMRNAFIHPKTLSFEQLEEAAENIDLHPHYRFIIGEMGSLKL